MGIFWFLHILWECCKSLLNSSFILEQDEKMQVLSLEWCQRESLYKALSEVSVYSLPIQLSQALSIDFNRHWIRLKVKAWLKHSIRKIWCNLLTTAFSSLSSGHKKCSLKEVPDIFWENWCNFNCSSLMEQPFHESVNQLLTHACLTHLTKIVQILVELSTRHTQSHTFKC